MNVRFHYLCLVIRPKRHCETATPGSFPGPNENAKEALSQRHSGRESPFRGGGGRWWIGDLKKRNAYALLLPMQRYDILRPIANQR